MDLLPLPKFHHLLMATIVIALLIIPTLFVAAIVKKKKKKSISKPPKDIYELSIALQELAPNDRRVQEVLEEIAAYKYNPQAPQIPKKLVQKMKRLYKELQKNKSPGRGKFSQISQ
ncbi:hypothetical protein [Nitratiruptor sp. SB155-2]|uniref:hypothetical protein n=1 Tax=Nitratiruptor sp. (strain SB155-2) TaxID=387092 RepID=UPI0002F1B63C|nr:hypothetical protein [Nitratiruptor sp. SB155-2]